MYDIGEYKRIEGSALKIQDERRTEMGILIRGGRIVDAATDTDKTGDIYLEDGIIAEIGQKLKKKDGDRVINNSTDFAMYLLEVGHVATVGGDAFGSPECFRMSYATSDENIIEAMKRIKETLARLK